MCIILLVLFLNLKNIRTVQPTITCPQFKITLHVTFNLCSKANNLRAKFPPFTIFLSVHIHSFQRVCKISYYHSSDDANESVLGCFAMSAGKPVQDGLLDPPDGGTTLLQQDCHYFPADMA